MWLGRTDLATHSHEALAIYDEVGDLGGKAVVLNNLGAFEYFRGAWDEAASLYAEGRDARLATGNDVDAAIGTINIGEILADQGRYEEGRHQLIDALRVLRAASYRYGIAYGTMLLGRLDARTGSFEEAHEHFVTARSEFNDIGLHFDASEVDSMVAECLVLEGRSQEALELAGRLVDGMEEQGSPRGVALVQRVRGYALLQGGDLAGARAAFEASRESALELKADYELVLTLVALVKLAELTGDRTAAAAWHSQIAALSDQLGITAFPEVPIGRSDLLGTAAEALSSGHRQRPGQGPGSATGKATAELLIPRDRQRHDGRPAEEQGQDVPAGPLDHRGGGGVPGRRNGADRLALHRHQVNRSVGGHQKPRSIDTPARQPAGPTLIEPVQAEGKGLVHEALAPIPEAQVEVGPVHLDLGQPQEG